MPQGSPSSSPDAAGRRGAPLSARSRIRFEALQRALVPLSGGFDEADRRRSSALVNRTLEAQPAAVRRQLAWLLAGIDAYCILRYRRAFRNLPHTHRLHALDALAGVRPAILRQGIDGLAILAKLGVYGQPRFYPTLGYRLRENPDD
jgi:hypothetical protein